MVFGRTAGGQRCGTVGLESVLPDVLKRMLYYKNQQAGLRSFPARRPKLSGCPVEVRHGPLSSELNINELQNTKCRTFRLNRKIGTNALFNRLICSCLDVLSVPNLPFAQRLNLFL